jgi:type VII secretion-associated serine protease mycosin
VATVLVAAATGIAPGLVLAPAPAYAAECGPVSDAPLPDQPWPLRRLRPDLVWPLTEGSDVTVAVIDSGVSDRHPALAGRLVAGLDLVDPSGDGTCDNVGHGTLIAGIIAGVSTPSSGFHGVAPAAKIMPIRVLESDDVSFDDQHPYRIADAIRLATDAGADVINLSLTTAPIEPLADAVAYALDHDVVVVAAAGNDGATQPDLPAFPAAYDGVIAVAGVDENGDHVPTSTPGDYVDIAAPGFRIEGPAPQGEGYLVMAEGGTSFAAGYVSGTVALLRAYRPGLSGPEVVDRVLRTADRPANGWDRDVGSGVVNPYWAVVSVAAEEDEEAPPGQVALTAPDVDPLRNVRLAAGWTAFVAVVLSGLIFASVSVIRRGQARHWRPGR